MKEENKTLSDEEEYYSDGYIGKYSFYYFKKDSVKDFIKRVKDKTRGIEIQPERKQGKLYNKIRERFIQILIEEAGKDLAGDKEE